MNDAYERLYGSNIRQYGPTFGSQGSEHYRQTEKGSLDDCEPIMAVLDYSTSINEHAKSDLNKKSIQSVVKKLQEDLISQLRLFQITVCRLASPRWAI